MPKHPGSGKGHRNGAVGKDGQVQHPTSGKWVKRDTATASYLDQTSARAPLKGARREILFPTEPTTIGHKKIDRAVERVISRKK